MIDIPFETLLESNSSKIRWYPTPITLYKHSLKLDMSIKNSNALLSNLAYNMQYIEFYTMLIKTYVITGMSILEGIFSNIVKSNCFISFV